MTVEDELVRELFRPDFYGNLGKDALIINIVGTRLFDYKLEETEEFPFWRTVGREQKGLKRKRFIERMTPDITITLKQENITMAIELENDINWDFQDSLRQLKKYKKKFSDARIIIPREYKRFAPLYYHEGFPVYLWNAKRKWECLRCHHVNVNESRIPPKCEGTKEKSCSNSSRDEFDLVGLKDTKIEQYTPKDMEE